MNAFRKQTKMWICGDGKHIRICDMSDSHLHNAIVLLERTAKANRDQELNAAYWVSSMLQGEMAQWDCDKAIERMEEDEAGEDFMPEIYDNLLTERNRRALNNKP